MNTTISYIISFTLAIVFHVAVFVLLMMKWDSAEVTEHTIIEQQYYIEANLINENPFDAKKRSEQEKKDKQRNRRIKKQQAIDKKNARLRKEAIELAKKKNLEKQLAEQRRLDQERARELVEKQLAEETAQDAARESITNETQRKEMEQSLAMSIREEQGARRAITDDEKAMAYVSQIQRDIISNWSRPPSARNGMHALLRVILVPTGEVIDVVVEEGSGNDAFDRSAILAVRKAQRFQVPSQSRQFERDFREFTVLFRPEDLRL